jgi:hypothetical protein
VLDASIAAPMNADMGASAYVKLNKGDSPLYQFISVSDSNDKEDFVASFFGISSRLDDNIGLGNIIITLHPVVYKSSTNDYVIKSGASLSAIKKTSIVTGSWGTTNSGLFSVTRSNFYSNSDTDLKLVGLLFSIGMRDNSSQNYRYLT